MKRLIQRSQSERVNTFLLSNVHWLFIVFISAIVFLLCSVHRNKASLNALNTGPKSLGLSINRIMERWVFCDEECVNSNTTTGPKRNSHKVPQLAHVVFQENDAVLIFSF